MAINNEIDVKSVGCSEWFIDAIIGWEIINNGLKEKENVLTKTQMIDYLSKYDWSNDSKKLVSNSYFKRMGENRLRQIFNYLKDFVENNNFTDIRKIETLPSNIDILTYSFPCQDISTQGLKKGLNQNTRSGLLYEVEKLLKKTDITKRPKILLLENVKNLVSKTFINDFDNWIKKLEDLGYKSYWKVLNSKDFNSAQNRERVFMVSVLKSKISKDFSFDDLKPNRKACFLKDIIKVDKNDRLVKINVENIEKQFKLTKNGIEKQYWLFSKNWNSANCLYKASKYGPTLTASGSNSELHFYLSKIKGYKTINSKEAFLYMGFDYKDWLKIKNTKLLSDRKMIYLCGNSISVEVLESIFKEVINLLN